MLSELLERIGPSLSSRLAAELCKTADVKPATARKRIERAKAANEIFAVPGIKFRHNEQFLYAKSQENTPVLQKALFSALMESKSTYRLPLLGIQARGGIVPEFLFPTISGFPLSARNRRQDCYAALSYLLKADLLVRNEITRAITVSAIFAPNIVSESRHNSRMIGESLLLYAIRDWCRLQGLLGLDKLSIRKENEHPQFGFFQWDLVAPSFLSPIAEFEYDTPKPGFVVVDVILGRKLTIADITPFLQKVVGVRANKNNRPFLAMLFADWFERDALIEGRKNGLLFTTPKNFFGRPFAELLDDLIQAFEHKSQFLRAEPDYLHKILANIRTIAHLQETTVEASRQLYLLLLGYCFSGFREATAVYNAMINQDLSVDLYIQTRTGLTVCQTNYIADKASLTESDVDNWLDSLPRLLSALKPSTKLPIQLLLCTNRSFAPEAIFKLEKSASTFPIAWVDAASLRQLLDSSDPRLNALIPDSILDSKVKE